MKKEGCLFELIYIKKEHALSGTRSIASRRIDLGRLLARQKPVGADFVVPIPETAILFAQGYSIESGIPLGHAILKKRPKEKTLFVRDRKRMLDEIWVLIPDLIEGKRLVLIDETVISGLSLQSVIRTMRSLKPREIHVRLAAPPMIRKCPSNSFSDTWKFIEGGWKKFFDVDSFDYLDLPALESHAVCAYCYGSKTDESKVVEL